MPSASPFLYVCSYFKILFLWVYLDLTYETETESESRSVLSDSLQPHGLVHGILQARILELVALPFSRGSSQPRNQTRVSCIAERFFTNWAIREAKSLFIFLATLIGLWDHSFPPGIEPVPLALGAQSPNHWTARGIYEMGILLILPKWGEP